MDKGVVRVCRARCDADGGDEACEDGFDELEDVGGLNFFCPYNGGMSRRGIRPCIKISPLELYYMQVRFRTIIHTCEQEQIGEPRDGGAQVRFRPTLRVVVLLDALPRVAHDVKGIRVRCEPGCEDHDVEFKFISFQERVSYLLHRSSPKLESGAYLCW